MPDALLDARNSTVKKSLPSQSLKTSGESKKKKIRKYIYNTMQRRGIDY